MYLSITVHLFFFYVYIFDLFMFFSYLFCFFFFCFLFFFFFFFFSSRRRHTRFDCDWSSDVCSSDLRRFHVADASGLRPHVARGVAALGVPAHRPSPPPVRRVTDGGGSPRSEEHTSELQSQSNLVCRLLLEKKN